MANKLGRGHCGACGVGLHYSKIVERGATMQLICPNCGRYFYQPVWGGKITLKRSIKSALRKLR